MRTQVDRRGRIQVESHTRIVTTSSPSRRHVRGLCGVQLDIHVDALKSQRGRDPPAKRTPDEELSAGQCPGHDPNVDLVDLDALDAHHRWRIKELGMELVVGEDLAPDLPQDLGGAADVDGEREGHVNHRSGPVS